MQVLNDDFETLDLLFESCNMDYEALKSQKIDENFLSDYSN